MINRKIQPEKLGLRPHSCLSYQFLVFKKVRKLVFSNWFGKDEMYRFLIFKKSRKLVFSNWFRKDEMGLSFAKIEIS